MKCALLLLALTAPVPVKEKIALPKSPPPTWGLATMKDGTLTVQQSVTVTQYRTEYRTRTVLRNGRQVQTTYAVPVAVSRVVYQTQTIAKPRFFDTAGKEIDAKRAANLLSSPRVVLMSADGKALDPFYLRTVRDSTIVVARTVLSQQFAPGIKRFAPQPGFLPPPLPPRKSKE